MVPKVLFSQTSLRVKMKINQRLVDETFNVRMGNCGLYNDQNDVNRIKDVLKTKLNIILSSAEAIEFWKWRSDEWDSSWLNPNYDDEIVDFFEKFISHVGCDKLCQQCELNVDRAECTCECSNSDDDTKENDVRPTAVKVLLVRDADEVPWEIELDSEYHKELLNDLERQAPEKCEGQRVRYSLEYDPKKILRCTKLDRCPACDAPTHTTPVSPPEMMIAILCCTKCSWMYRQ